MAYFAVINEQGPAWITSRPMREQEKWPEHADFVNRLVRQGFIVIAGPVGIGPTHRALLLISAEDETVVRDRLAEDPWVRAGILRTLSIDPWKVLASDDRLDRVLAEITRAKPSE